jgi:hypothetical protein
MIITSNSSNNKQRSNTAPMIQPTITEKELEKLVLSSLLMLDVEVESIATVLLMSVLVAVVGVDVD